MNDAHGFLERDLRNKDSSDPVLNKPARERHNSVALDGLSHHGAREQPPANIGRVVKPEETLAAPAWLQLCFVLAMYRSNASMGFLLEIHGETKTGAGGQNNNDENDPGQVQSAPTGRLVAAATTSR